MNNDQIEYGGFEIGPIRPPSEADSLLIRVTRNCPWNKCMFCGVYKGQKFSIRPADHVIRDIEGVKMCIDMIRKANRADESERPALLNHLIDTPGVNRELILSAMSWYQSGMKSVFLQDANSLVIKPDDMVRILKSIKENFPEVERITTYARSDTLARISNADMERMAKAGLNRIHSGMESGSDTVLKLIRKGEDKAAHIAGGQRVKRAGISLSEYFIPGLGGREFSEENALQTADALNQIDPDYIRIRTLAVNDRSGLSRLYEDGTLTRTNDAAMAREILLLIENLHGITSTIVSDHIVNLIPEVEGRLPEDKEKMLAAIRWFLDLSEEEQMIYRVGRRTGIIKNAAGLTDSSRRERAVRFMKENGIDASNIDAVIDEILKRFI